MAVKNIDPYDYEEMKYEPNYLGIKKLGPVMIICGQSNSGKSVILNNIFRRKLIYEYECKNVYFFSKTIRGDLTYKPTLKLLSTRTDPPSKINIFKTVDFEMINKIVEK
jgi:septin family protein